MRFGISGTCAITNIRPSKHIFSTSIRTIGVIASPIVCIWAYILSTLKPSTGLKPFFSDKYDITKHPNYKYLSDYDKRNEIEVEKVVGTKAKLKPNDTVEVADMGEIEADDTEESED